MYPTSMSAFDAEFLQQVARHGHAELQAGLVALERGSTSLIRRFAQRMVDEYAQFESELDGLAANRGIALPDRPDGRQLALITTLATAVGEGFDRRYVHEFGVHAHEQLAALCTRAAETADDADTRAFAAHQLAMLRQRLEIAQAMKAAVELDGLASG